MIRMSEMEGKEKLHKSLPETPGVYLMKDAHGKILYIGKAGNLRRRVSSYFQKAHEYRIERLLREVKKIGYKKTDTAIEALILESELIKKYKPPYNVREKDDKSFLYVEITHSSYPPSPKTAEGHGKASAVGKPLADKSKGTAKEKFPRVLLVRGKSKLEGERFGPFTSAASIREALRILRRIFPYSVHPERNANAANRGCFEYQIGLCPGTCVGAISHADYMKNIRNLELFFRGKKARVVKNLQKEMKTASKKLEFERAAKLRGQIFALTHIQDVALITESDTLLAKPYTPVARYRIEGYDISNISGTSAVGSMAVFTDGESDKNEYRKFKIRTIRKSDDVGMLKEVLRRRFSRRPSSLDKGEGWPLPDLLLIDGGKGQVNTAKQVLEEYGFRMPVVGIAKGPRRKKNEFIGTIPKGVERSTLIRVRDEAHRFAIQYHKKVRGKEFLKSRTPPQADGV